MFFLCYVPFHLTAPFHTIPRGPESGDRVVHVTVIIFFSRDKDTNCRDSALILHAPLPRLWYCAGDSGVCSWQKPQQSRPILCAETLFRTEPYCVWAQKACPHVNTEARTHKHTKKKTTDRFYFISLFTRRTRCSVELQYGHFPRYFHWFHDQKLRDNFLCLHAIKRYRPDAQNGVFFFFF